MAKINTVVIKGGKPLRGEVSVGGAKNSAPKIMVSTLLTDQRCTIENIPGISDKEITTALIRGFGGEVGATKPSTLTIKTAKFNPLSLKDLSKISGSSRIPILTLGPQLLRSGKAILPGLGGCDIGPRPIDFHINALKQMGATLYEADGLTYLRAEHGLKGTEILLPYPSVGATEQVLLSATLAKGTTILDNAATEPEIRELILSLQKMGARITTDNRKIIIQGVNKLSGFSHKVMTDKIEVASWACAAIATDGEVLVKNANQEPLFRFLDAFVTIGGGFKVEKDGIRFFRQNGKLRSLHLETNVHPGFATDWQQPFVVTLTQSHGMSPVHETVYENRLGYVETLDKMGAKIERFNSCLGTPCRFAYKEFPHSAIISGPTKLKGAKMEIPDLRAGISYVIAALVAEGQSTITNFSLLNRGYENLTQNLQSVGAEVRVVN